MTNSYSFGGGDMGSQINTRSVGNNVEFHAEVYVRISAKDPDGKKLADTALKLKTPDTAEFHAAVREAGEEAVRAHRVQERTPGQWWKSICREVKDPLMRQWVAGIIWWAYGQRNKRATKSQNKAWQAFREEYCIPPGQDPDPDLKHEDMDAALQRLGFREPHYKPRGVSKRRLMSIARALLDEAKRTDFEKARKGH